MKENKKIKIGVLGAANIALRSFVPELKILNNNFDFVGIASRRNPEQVSFEGKVFKGYESILDKSVLDAIYIPLPNALHFEWVKKSLQKGLHVLVEKSLACNEQEVIELNKIARNSNLVLVENFQFRFHSQLNAILKILDKGTIGDLRIIRSTFCFPPFPDKENIRYNNSLGGGALLDAGAYPLKLSQILMGNNIYVSSAVLNKKEGFDVDIWGGAFLQQNNGNLFSQIAFGFDNYYQCNLEVIGSKGKLYSNRIFTAKSGFQPVVNLETNQDGLREIQLKEDNHFRNMLLYFYDLITGIRDKNQEYLDNINQSRLLNEIKIKSNE
ncbi:hypothetical protein DET49_12544 [Salegentibacter sp. 24]|uniref:Gfo/Idh/MocA family protein n=1 Tax=Salegentibacter sp. 24 TaxID=2183986 RepID=UPI00106202D9|nr:Gfo/Idh/MocA family oxidoreductase [Salegentibacter sp. 24]TDN82190.1 hypothetical protein DET49_12544 [Salegentibacter sp. 24]